MFRKQTTVRNEKYSKRNFSIFQKFKEAPNKKVQKTKYNHNWKNKDDILKNFRDSKNDRKNTQNPKI